MLHIKEKEDRSLFLINIMSSSEESIENKTLYLYLTISPDNEDEVFAFKTIKTKEFDSCAICYYDTDSEDSDNDNDNDEECMEDILNQDTVFEINRYCRMWISKDEDEEKGHNICNHQFHTLCLHKWIKTSKKFKCPYCNQGSNTILEDIPELLVKPAEYIVKYWSNGRILEEYHTINGKIDGWHKSFDPDGYPVSKTYYILGQKDGIDIEYHANSHSLKKTQLYHNGERHGLYKEYDQDGETVVIDGNYIHGNKEGEWKEKHVLSHSRKLECNYVENLNDGLYRTWSISGVLTERRNYEREKKIGRWIMCHQLTGQVLKKCYYTAEGFLDGLYLEWYPPKKRNSKKILKKRAHFENGVMVGICCIFHDNGKLHRKKEYNTEGKDDGEFLTKDRFGYPLERFYYENGNLKGMSIKYGERGKPLEYAEYENNMLHGKYMKMYPSGNCQLFQTYQKGILDGWSAVLSRQGKMVWKKKYVDGVEVAHFDN